MTKESRAHARTAATAPSRAVFIRSCPASSDSAGPCQEHTDVCGQVDRRNPFFAGVRIANQRLRIDGRRRRPTRASAGAAGADADADADVRTPQWVQVCKYKDLETMPNKSRQAQRQTGSSNKVCGSWWRRPQKFKSSIHPITAERPGACQPATDLTDIETIPSLP